MITRIQPKAFVFCLTGRVMRFALPAASAQALELAETFEFDVLISDIGLPDGSGTHLLESLNRKKGRLMRAIAMSGFGMEQDRERSLTAGFAEHLTKPVEFADLQRAITKLVGTLNAHRQ